MSHNHSPDEVLLWGLIEMDEGVVKEALQGGADVNRSSPSGTRPLHVAALRGSALIINSLVGHKAAVDQADNEGFTPLMVAALNGRTDAVTALLEAGANPKQTRLNTGETSLHLAMNGVSKGVVRALLDAGADINAQTTEDESTPLHIAAQFDAKGMANVLLSDPLCEAETKDSKGCTAAEVAREKGHHALAEYLDLCTAPKSDCDQDLVSAVMKLQEEAARRALKAGANANQSSLTGARPLHAAALRGSAPLIYTLVEHKAEVDQGDAEGFTPLMVAALNGRTDAVKALLDCCANPKLTRMDTGETALHMAMNGGSPGVVRALLDAGVNVNAQTTEDKFTPLHYAAKFNASDLSEILKGDPHCDPDITDSKQRTAAQLAQGGGQEARMAPDTSDGSVLKVSVITAERPVPPSEDVYKVLSEPRGRVLILNYEEFENKINDRKGAREDRRMLDDLFTEMGYDVTVMVNLDNLETKKALKDFGESEELDKVDSVVVCVLSHGKDTKTFITADDETMTVGEVYSFFTDGQCSSLRGKPKLFLFNFCRGKQIEAGCVLAQAVSDAVPINKPIEEKKKVDTADTKEILKDRISLYATVEGVSALRTEEGTFFARAITRTFSTHSHRLHVEELVKKVNKHMTGMMGGTTPETESTLKKKFYLNPIRKRRHPSEDCG